MGLAARIKTDGTLGIDRRLQDGVYDENGKPIRTAPKQSRARKADAADLTALARMDNMGRQSWKYSMKNHKTLSLVCLAATVALVALRVGVWLSGR